MVSGSEPETTSERWRKRGAQQTQPPWVLSVEAISPRLIIQDLASAGYRIPNSGLVYHWI